MDHDRVAVFRPRIRNGRSDRSNDLAKDAGMAEWKDVHGFTAYEVSSDGCVRLKHNKHPMKPYMTKDGYARINFNEHGKRKNVGLHRLVAMAFIPNPEGKPQVNHKNGNKLDNRVSNLEWATARENAQHAVRTGLCDEGIASRSVPIVAINLSSGEISHYRSMREASRTLGIQYGRISEIVRGERNRTGNYVFEKENLWQEN